MLFSPRETSLDKEDIVFIHGFLGCHRDWNSYFPHFEKDYNVIAVNLPGHGKMSFYPIENLCQSLRKKSHLVGYSLGGRIALKMITENPDFFSSAVIISAHPGLISEKERENKKIEEKKWIDLLKANDIDTFLKEWYSQPMFKGAYIPSYRKEQNCKNLLLAMKEFSPSIFPSYWDDLNHISIPITYVYGELDVRYQAVYNKIEKTKILVKNAHHAIPLEKKGVCIQIIQDHLRRL